MRARPSRPGDLACVGTHSEAPAPLSLLGAGAVASRGPYTCSNRGMGVRRPDWWCYPERCQNGHEWGPGLITVSWVLCDCPAAQAASGGGAAGHMAVFCNAAPGCRSVWYRPRHEPGLSLGTHR
jgi:hypothetical protein